MGRSESPSTSCDRRLPAHRRAYRVCASRSPTTTRPKFRPEVHELGCTQHPGRVCAQQASQLSERRTFLNNQDEETMKRYEQLSLEERYQIFALKRARWTQASIARHLGRNPSTISRELRRNTTEHWAFDIGQTRIYRKYRP